MQKLRVLEFFAGIGACSKALERLNIPHEIVNAVEIDKYAMKAFNAIHGTNFEPQDITKWDNDIEVDLIMHGSPCQSFSLAGLQHGGDKGSGTRSSLMWETVRIVDKLKPKYVVWENVKNVLSKKHRHNFDAYLKAMEQLGYTNYYQVLNAKDYGTPQNRERVFTISIRNDIHTNFTFPIKQPLKLKLKDLLEDEVDEKYYLSDKMINYIASNNEKWTGNNNKSVVNKSIASTINTGEGQRRCDASNYIINSQDNDIDLKEVVRKYGIFDTEESTHQAGSVYDTNGLSPTLDTMQGGYRQPCIEIKNATKQGYLEVTDGDDVYISNIDKKRGTVQKEMIPTLKTSPDIGVVVHRNLKQTLCNKLIQENKVQEMDVISHSYSTSRINDWNTRNFKHNNLSSTLSTRCDWLGVTVKTIGNYSPSGHNASRIVDNNGIAPTVMENHGTVTATQYACLRIRKLTPKECWRLMGFDDEDFEKAKNVPTSNAQLYKMAGNSIVVGVLEAIFKELLKDYMSNSNRWSDLD